MKRLVCESLEELNEYYSYEEPEEKMDPDEMDRLYNMGKENFEKEGPAPAPESEGEITPEEFDEVLDQIFNSGGQPIEIIDTIREFIKEHDYINKQLGDLPGKDKYARNWERVNDYFEENRDAIEDAMEARGYM